MEKEEPIRIAQIIGKWIGGGVESVVMNYYRNIDHNKIQFDFFCDEDSTNIPYEEIENLGGKVILIPPYQRLFKYQKELRKYLKDGKYKIIHSHINTLSIFSLYAAKKVGVPVRIAHSHSTTAKKEWKKNLIKQILRPFSKKYATNYMSCSEHAGRWLFGNKTYDRGKVYLLNNAIDLDRFKYDKEIRNKKRKELGIKEDTLVIGNVGRFVAQKNHSFLIDIFNEYQKENNNSILMLIGQGPLMDEIKSKVKKLKIENKVLFLGQKNNVNEYYSAMDLFLFPSLYEGLGMSLVEAQANGLPCIASDEVPKISKVLECVEFLKNDESIDKWVITIKKMIKCCECRNSQISFNQRFERKGYSIEKEQNKLVNYYQMFFNLNSEKTTLPLSISECRSIQLAILKEINVFTKINGLRYSLGYGSMLGAIRHKGFIPWDDDIDIIMPREDYEKFKSKYKSESYEIISSSSDGYFYPFMKLVDRNTYVKMADNTTIHGIWIDIFPIDKIPNNTFFRKIFLLRNFWLRSLLISATTDFNEKIIKKKNLKRTLKVICEIFGKQNVVKHYEKLNKKYVNKNKEYFSCLSSPYTLREVYKSDDLFSNLKKYEFENYEFNGINNYDSYLKMLYGDYMKLPPIDKRRTHRIEAWRLDNEK